MWHLTRLDLHTLEHTWPDGAQREQDGGKRTRRELGSLLILGLTRCPRPLPTVQWAEQTLSSWGSEQVISKGAGFEPWPSEPHLTRTHEALPVLLFTLRPSGVLVRSRLVSGLSVLYP